MELWTAYRSWQLWLRCSHQRKLC